MTASSHQQQSRNQPLLSVPKIEAAAKIKDRVDQGAKLLDSPIGTPNELYQARQEEEKWSKYNVELLQRLFSSSTYAAEYQNAIIPQRDVYAKTFYPKPINEEASRFRRQIRNELNVLESVLERLELIPESIASLNALTDSSENVDISTNVFIVHGHDNMAKETVARFVERLDLKPIILHEQASEGKTIIEKLETFASDVGYAIIILTPDDLGAEKTKSKDLQPRARQNVIFELGFFFGLLGRNRVCALHDQRIEIPSDLSGVVYIPMDEHEAWKTLLAKELKQAGLNIDLNML